MTDSCNECSEPRDVTSRECLAVIVVVICHLRSVHVVTLTQVVPLVLGLSLSSSTPILSISFIIPCADLILAFHGTWSRSVVRSFQLKTLQYLPDVPLVRLNCDAATTSLDDPIQYSSTLLKVCVFSNHLLLDLIFPRYLTAEKFHCRPFTTDRDVVSVHGRHDVLALDVPVPHARACDPSRQLEIAERRGELFLPNLSGVARAIQAVLQQPARVFIAWLTVLGRWFNEYSPSCWSVEVRSPQVNQCTLLFLHVCP